MSKGAWLYNEETQDARLVYSHLANQGSSEPDYEVGVEQVYVLNGMNQCLWTLSPAGNGHFHVKRGVGHGASLGSLGLKRSIHGLFRDIVTQVSVVVCRMLLHHVHGQCLEGAAQRYDKLSKSNVNQGIVNICTPSFMAQ